MSERTIAFGKDGALVGTLCLPDAPGAGRPALGQILFNAGVVHRVGPHRINVRLARRLARRNVPSLRFDLAGQGDSARPAGDMPFERQAVADLVAAMDALAGAAGVDRFSLFGFCSGGCHSYAAAQVEPRVAGVILYDTYIYRTPKSRLNRYLAKIRDRGLAATAAGWLGRKRDAVLRALRGTAGREPAPPAATESGGFATPSPAEFARVVRGLHERGTKVGMMYSGGFEEYNYAGQFHDALRPWNLDVIVSCDYFPDMGHSTTVIAAQAAFIDRIDAWTAELASRPGKYAGGG